MMGSCASSGVLVSRCDPGNRGRRLSLRPRVSVGDGALPDPESDRHGIRRQRRRVDRAASRARSSCAMESGRSHWPRRAACWAIFCSAGRAGPAQRAGGAGRDRLAPASGCLWSRLRDGGGRCRDARRRREGAGVDHRRRRSSKRRVAARLRGGWVSPSAAYRMTSTTPTTSCSRRRSSKAAASRPIRSAEGGELYVSATTPQQKELTSCAPSPRPRSASPLPVSSLSRSPPARRRLKIHGLDLVVAVVVCRVDPDSGRVDPRAHRCRHRRSPRRRLRCRSHEPGPDPRHRRNRDPRRWFTDLPHHRWKRRLLRPQRVVPPLRAGNHRARRLGLLPHRR